MDFRVVIPARYDSSRLPGKVLLDIAGKPMIQHVYERSVDSGAETVVIATDDKRVADAAEKFGAQVCMTASEHQSGTERLSEVAIGLEYDHDDIIVCVQGDEPLIPAHIIRKVAEDLREFGNVKVSSVCVPIKNPDDLFDPNIVKVVLNKRNFAMLFSRAPIPWQRDTFSDKTQIKLSGLHYRHVGIYAYRAGFLEEYVNWPVSDLEECESLEQLRVLFQGGRIHMLVTKTAAPIGVDTQEDLEKVRSRMKS